MYDLEIRATDANNINPHFYYDDPQEMLKALVMITAQDYDVLVSEVHSSDEE